MYLEELAQEIRDQVSPAALPDADTDSLFLLYAVLLLAKGEATSAEDVHNAWACWMVSRGEAHPSLVPFSSLDAETRAEDSPFVVAIRSVARSRG